ncbi:MAG: type VI secretion system tip protein TssI/VgrG [Byssovorax sp.]
MTDSIELQSQLTVDGTAYTVLRLSSREPLDDLGEIRCEITDRKGGPDPASLTGKPLVLTLSREGGHGERTIAGYVVEAERSTDQGEGEHGTRLVARPRLFRLTQRADCRVFQDMTAPDIVKAVLEGAGVPADAQHFQLDGDYPKRVYTTQYRETDYDFLRRLLSEEGIAFAIDSSSGADIVTFFDADLGPIDGDSTLPHLPGDGLHAAKDAIFAARYTRSTAPGKVNLRDYDFQRPKLDLNAKAAAGDAGEASLEVYSYPGRFTDPARGDRLAGVLLDSLRARRETLAGNTSTLRLHPGKTFDLDQHPYAPLNQAYFVIEVRVEIDGRRAAGPRARGADLLGRVDERASTGPRERITFTAVPAANAPYRPPRLPRAVASPGAQIAVTTGPSGKEFYPDEHGRVKVIFPWDRLGKRDETSSLWIRTCQLPLGGSMLTPRVGWEVMLDFTDGDPDLPFVFGRMYNGKVRPPYELPKHKTRMSIQTATTPGGGSSNEIRMDDKAGSEEMFMNASRDASVSAGNNATESIGNNESRTIGANQSLSVTDSMAASIGADQKMTVGGNQSVHVSTFLVDDVGSHSLSIAGNRDIKAGGDHKRTTTGASTLSIGGMQVDLVAGSVDENGLATMDDSIGAALVELTAASRTVWVDGARTEKAGAAKIIISGGGRMVTVGAGLSHKVAGAIINKIKGDRADDSSADFVEVAGGAHIIKAANVVFAADDLLTVIMGGSTLTMTPASVSIAGTSITFDGEVTEDAALVVDN